MEDKMDSYVGEVDAKIILAEIKAEKQVQWHNVIMAPRYLVWVAE